jgi:hypothetical protein
VEGNAMSKKQVEVEFEGRLEVFELEHGPDFRVEVLVEAIRTRLGVGEDVILFIRETEREFRGEIEEYGAVLVGHRCRRILVEVGYEHLTKPHEFVPSLTVFHVLQWAIGKHGFNLDPTARSKANLIVPGAAAPLPREDVIGKHATDCKLIVALTLQDFTNG